MLDCRRGLLASEGQCPQALLAQPGNDRERRLASPSSDPSAASVWPLVGLLVACPPFSLLMTLCPCPLQRRSAAYRVMASARFLGFLLLAQAARAVDDVRSDSSEQGAYTLNLHPPEEDAGDVKASLDALMKAERAKGHATDNVFNSEKERMLAAEKAELAAIVSEAFKPLLEAVAGAGRRVVHAHRPASFLLSAGESAAHSAGYTLKLHPPEEDAREVTASLDALMQAERAKQQEADNAFSAEKARMLAAEKAELAAIVREAFKPLVEALGERQSSAGGGHFNGLRPTSFLSSGVLPVDPDRIRTGLRLTEPLRSALKQQ